MLLRRRPQPPHLPPLALAHLPTRCSRNSAGPASLGPTAALGQGVWHPPVAASLPLGPALPPAV